MKGQGRNRVSERVTHTHKERERMKQREKRRKRRHLAKASVQFTSIAYGKSQQISRKERGRRDGRGREMKECYREMEGG